jgi:glutamine synthetase
MLLAGLDGIQNKIDPGEPSDYDLFEHGSNGHGPVKQVPGSLPEALAALEADHKFLLAGGVFTEDVLSTWIEMKRSKEIDPIRLRPHPYEFYLYYDA